MIPKQRQTFLFSATMTSKVAKLQRASLQNPVRVEVSSKYSTAKGLIQSYLFIPAKYKDAYLVSMLSAYACIRCVRAASAHFSPSSSRPKRGSRSKAAHASLTSRNGRTACPSRSLVSPIWRGHTHDSVHPTPARAAAPRGRARLAASTRKADGTLQRASRLSCGLRRGSVRARCARPGLADLPPRRATPFERRASRARPGTRRVARSRPSPR